jgi:hypothetical protein
MPDIMAGASFGTALRIALCTGRHRVAAIGGEGGEEFVDGGECLWACGEAVRPTPGDQT